MTKQGNTMHNTQQKLSALNVLNEAFDLACQPYGGLSASTSTYDNVEFIKIYRTFQPQGKPLGYQNLNAKEVEYLANIFEKAGIPITRQQELSAFVPQTVRSYSTIAPTAVIMGAREAGQDKVMVNTGYADCLLGQVKAQSMQLSLANDKTTQIILMGADAFYMLHRKSALIKALSL